MGNTDSNVSISFHFIAIAGKELNIVVKKLTGTNFTLNYIIGMKKHKDYLNERSENPNEKGYYLYKHRSLKRYIDYAFTYEKYPELNIERTTNRLGGLLGS